MDAFHFSDLKPSKTVRQKRRDKRLHEEVIETGRCKSAKRARGIKIWNESGRKKTIQQETALGSLRSRESIRDGRTVLLRDNLEPLERWLAAQIGRPWAAVYADLGAIANPNSMHGEHIRAHLWQFVAKNSWFDDSGGTVIADQYGRPSPIGQSWARFFIHPKTGIFLAIKREEKGGPFPKKARFKKEKSALKSKARQGIDTSPAPERPGFDVSNWPFFRTRDKRVSPGDRFDFLQNGTIFRAEVQKIEETGGYFVRKTGEKTRTRYGSRLSLSLKIVSVFTGTAHQNAQLANLVAFPGESPDWAVFDEKRLFGNRGWGHKHWALTRKPIDGAT